MIMQKLLFLYLSVILFSCNSSVENNSNTEESSFVFDVVKPSEMSLLMNHMLEVNDSVKNNIIAGKLDMEFPKEFSNIYTAELTETKYRTEIFEVYSEVFIENEKAIFNTENDLPLVDKYNNAINTCLACHKTECTGPIPKIRKLLIN